MIGGGQYALGRKAVSFTLFDQNVLMLLYIYLTAQLQHSEIWIPFTGLGAMFMTRRTTSCTIPPIPRISIATWAQAWRSGTGRRQLAHAAVEPPGLAFGVSGHRHDPHGVMGLVVDPAINALKALARASAFRRTAAGSEPPSVGRAGLPAAD